MKTLKFLILLAIAFCISWSLAACGEDDELDIPNKDENENVKPETSVAEIVQRNTYVNSSYSDYTFNFTITSKVKHNLPNDNVQYGIGHGSTSNTDEVIVSVGSQAYYYTITTNGDTETVTFQNPFWFYYVFTDTDKDKWAMCEIYYRTYMKLKKKGYSQLTSNEKDLYDEVTDYLDECQNEVERYYRPIICVIVNNKYYKIKTAQIY